jgi:uncharacterized membrane protein YraQ (UPF0718 family)
MEFLDNLLTLSLDAAPWLLLGLIIGGLFKTLLPTAWLEKHLQGDGPGPVVKAAVLGAPLPLCSCGVLPAAMGLRRAGASKGATTSFLVATPETGVDSVSVTFALLGPLMAIVRPIAAVTSAITAGLLVGRQAELEAAPAETAEVASCCAGKQETKVEETSCSSSKKQTSSCSSAVEKKEAVAESCCGSKAVAATPVEAKGCCSGADNAGAMAEESVSWRDGLHYAFTDLLSKLVFWLVVGLVFSAAVQTWVPPTFLAEWGSGLLAMLVMVLVSIPMYVCATASTPIAAGLLASGISPGTVLVFLLAGPASNIGSLGVIRQELGQRALVAYLSGVVVVAILAGYLLDWLIVATGSSVQAQVSASHHLLPHWLAWVSLAVMVIASLNSLRKS